MEKITKIQERESVDRVVSIFKKASPTKEEMLLTIGIAYMAGMEKGKQVN